MVSFYVEIIEKMSEIITDSLYSFEDEDVSQLFSHIPQIITEIKLKVKRAWS